RARFPRRTTRECMPAAKAPHDTIVVVAMPAEAHASHLRKWGFDAATLPNLRQSDLAGRHRHRWHARNLPRMQLGDERAYTPFANPADASTVIGHAAV